MANRHMNSFFPGVKKWLPQKGWINYFFAAGQDPGGERKWGPDRGQLEAGLAQIDRGKMGSTFDTQWAVEVATWRPERPESSPKGLRYHAKRQEIIDLIAFWAFPDGSNGNRNAWKGKKPIGIIAFSGQPMRMQWWWIHQKVKKTIGLIAFWVFPDGSYGSRNAWKGKKPLV